MLRSNFTGWSDSVDQVLAMLTDDDLADSPFPHFRHPIPRSPRRGAMTLLGDAAHAMPSILAQGTNQALLDTMVLCKALSDFRIGADGHTGDLSARAALVREDQAAQGYGRVMGDIAADVPERISAETGRHDLGLDWHMGDDDFSGFAQPPADIRGSQPRAVEPVNPPLIIPATCEG